LSPTGLDEVMRVTKDVVYDNSRKIVEKREQIKSRQPMRSLPLKFSVVAVDDQQLRRSLASDKPTIVNVKRMRERKKRRDNLRSSIG
jgi:hypothetical protein